MYTPRGHYQPLGRLTMRALMLATMTVLLTATVSAADSPFLGTWKLNLAKSERDAALLKIQKRTVVYTADGSVIRAVVTTDGKAQTPVIYDGREHAVDSATGLYTHATSTASGRTLETELKKHGKVVGTRKNSLSADGRTMTVVMDVAQADGTRVHSVAVYDKE
jgi:hypothetical protein